MAPVWLRGMVGAARSLVAQPPIDDIVLRDWAFEPDPSQTPRLTLLLPNAAHDSFFGGHATGIDLFLAIGEHLRANAPCDMRVLVTDPTAQTDLSLVTRRRADGQELEVSVLEDEAIRIPSRGKEVFVAFNWWTAHNIRSVVEARDTHFSAAALPLLYLIQEYEPQIFPLGSAHLLAREAYDRPNRLWAIFNSSLLRDWFSQCGHDAERSFVFEPAMDSRLRAHLARAQDTKRKKRILVYGRHTVSRNCWPALVRGLRKFVQDFPEFTDWEIVSAGSAHPPVDLGSGHTLRPLGKLPLDEYALALLQSSVGVSLMASPHPSYPPLEMAHFGLRTVTNTYWAKDLSASHSNILSTPSIDAVHLAKTIADACRLGPNADAVPSATYLREKPLQLAAEIADELRREWAS